MSSKRKGSAAGAGAVVGTITGGAAVADPPAAEAAAPAAQAAPGKRPPAVVAVPVPLPVSAPAAVVPAVLADPSAVVPVRAITGSGSRGIVLGPDLLRGTPGNLVTLPGDRVLSNGRWAGRFNLWRPADVAILADPGKLSRWVERTADVIGYSERTDTVDGSGSEAVRGAVLGMLTPAPGGAPVDRTALVLDAPDVAEANDDPSEFFRLYVGAGGVVVCIPDAYVQSLGDPDRLFPAVLPGAYTDGVSGFMVSGSDVTDRAVRFLSAWVAPAPAAGATAAPAPAAPARGKGKGKGTGAGQ